MRLKLRISKDSIRVFSFITILSFLVSIIPWDILNPRGYFNDRDGYFFAYDFKRYRLDGFEAERFYDYITNEWLWRYLNSYARNILEIPPELFFGIITFLAFFTYSYFILDLTKRPIILIYLLNIEFISFIYSQLRLALAMSVFIIAIQLFKYKKYFFSIVFVCFSILLHTSMLIFISLLLISIAISRLQISNLNKFFLILLTGVFVNLLIGPLREVILSSVGDRRAEYGDFSPPFYWYLIYVIYFIIVVYKALVLKINLFDNYIYNYAFIIFSLLLTSLVLGGYTSRFVVAATVFIIPSLFIIKKGPGIIFQSVYILYLIFLWIGFLL